MFFRANMNRTNAGKNQIPVREWNLRLTDYINMTGNTDLQRQL